MAHGRSIDEAARSGRISILGAPGSLEWVTPVLYVRGQPSQLFTLTTPGTGREVGQQEIPAVQVPLAPQFTEPAAAKSSWTEAADRTRQELATHPAEPLRRINSAWGVHAVCWHPDGHCVACATGTYARVYDVSDKEPAEELAVKAAIGVLNPRVHSVAFSPDGARLATGSWQRPASQPQPGNVIPSDGR
jgi:hypothetical protein